MTVQHDLSLEPGARTNRRITNLEQGHTASQQTGAWVKNVTQCGTFENGSETPSVINCLQFEIPAYGQYVVNTKLDMVRSSQGWGVSSLYFNGVLQDNNLLFFSTAGELRAPASHSVGGFMEKGQLVQLKGWVSGGGGTPMRSYAGIMVIHKIA